MSDEEKLIEDITGFTKAEIEAKCDEAIEKVNLWERKARIFDLIVAEAEKIIEDNRFKVKNLVFCLRVIHKLIKDIADYPNVERWKNK